MTPELAWICLAFTGLITTSRAASYDEHLLLRPLPEASLLGSFNFRSSISESSFRSQNFGTFPRSLGQILLHSHTEELHLRFSTGRWDSETWGARPWNGTKEGGTGVELWAWMEAESDEQYVQIDMLHRVKLIWSGRMHDGLH
jgi:phosphatidylinositol glycan class T